MTALLGAAHCMTGLLAPLVVFPVFPPQASTMAGRVDAIYTFAVALTIFFSILIATLVLGFFVRYRRKRPNEIGAPIHGSNLLEAVWSVIPLGIVLALFLWGTDVYFALARPPADATEYTVVGKQWMWKIQHPEGKREINELHVPVGRPIKLTMTSEDVIHSFFIPAFRVKSDVLPGRYTTIWFEATRPGRYHLFCAEYCGAEHSKMIGSVVAMEPKNYEAWLHSGTATPTVAATGAELFVKHACNTCHRPDTTARGPSLDDLFGKAVTLADGRQVTADDNYLRESIVNPAAKVVAGYDPVMPTFKGQLSEENIMALVRYIKEGNQAQ